MILETWTVEELSNVLQMPATALRRKIAYWQTQGLLREEATDKFVLVEEHKGRAPHDIIVTDDDEAESAMASAQTQREEELQVLSISFIFNTPPFPPKKIQTETRKTNNTDIHYIYFLMHMYTAMTGYQLSTVMFSY